MEILLIFHGRGFNNTAVFAKLFISIKGQYQQCIKKRTIVKYDFWCNNSTQSLNVFEKPEIADVRMDGHTSERTRFQLYGHL